MAEGKFSIKDATDAMELGVNKHILESDIDVTSRDIETVKENIDKLTEMVNLLPTQTKRTDEMVELQQFSTPPQIAYVVNWLANINKKDVVLEPSAGIGGIAVFAKKAEAEVIVNELSPRRAELLKELNFDQVFTENAEQINNVLPDSIKPTIVVMNPPFSTSVRGSKTTLNAGKHIEQALKTLQPNGRLVAIVGQGMYDTAPQFKTWWNKIKSEYNVVANVGLDGKNYKKYGTTFGNQILIIDKTGPTTETITDSFSDLNSLVERLESVSNDRPTIDKEVKSKTSVSNSEKLPVQRTPETKRGTESAKTVSDATNDDVDKQISVPEPRPSGRTESNTVENGKPVESTGDLQTSDMGQFSGIRPESEQIPGRRTEANVSNTEKGPNENGRDNGKRNTGTTTTTKSNNAGGIKIETIKKEDRVKADFENEDLTFEQYVPQKLKVKGVKQHPTKLVESTAMATVEPPDPTYSPMLDKSTVEKGAVSDAQLESVVYAGQAHEHILPNGERQGYMIGDGTGVGKGREIAAIITDNFNQGRTKAVWISKNQKLLPSAKRDWEALGNTADDVFLLNDHKKPIDLNSGVCFLGYSTLAVGSNIDLTKHEINDVSGKMSRLNQIIEWLGKDFDGVIAFDESHEGGNLLSKKPTANAKAMAALQWALPKARIIYVSATGASEISNFGYVSRLGLWGEGTQFKDANDFVGQIEEGGLAAMEVVAKDMKASGKYISRTLSLEGVEYEPLTHTLTPVQREIYTRITNSWQVILNNIEKALKITDSGKSGDVKGNINRAFWGNQQRFFNQLLVSLTMPSVIKDMKAQIEKGNSCVIQLVNTGEAQETKAITKAKLEDVDLDDIEFSPLDGLIEMVTNSFPVIQHEEVEEVGIDRSGRQVKRKAMVPVKDSNGNFVINKEALAMREELIADLKEISLPESPLEILLREFGVDNIAEVTGRQKRVVYKPDPKSGVLKRFEESRSDKVKEADVGLFMEGEKRILVFSQAGGTGMSYHASNQAKNKQRRIHYILQAGFNAASAIQGIGRTHRSDQASAPLIKIVSVDLNGSKRFVSTIARRIAQLGAITKGQRDAGSGGVFSDMDNLETSLAFDALAGFYKLAGERKLPGLDLKSVTKKIGLYDKFYDEYGKFTPDPMISRKMTTFLNRILCLDYDEQNTMFQAFMDTYERIYDDAVRNDKVDKGLETYKAEKVVVNAETVINTDPSGAETKYISLTATKKNKFHDYSFIENAKETERFEGVYKINNTNDIVAAFRSSDKTLTDGRIVKQFRLVYPQRSKGTLFWVEESFKEKTTPIPEKNWENDWENDISNSDTHYEEQVHLIGGALLPVWGKIKSSGNTKVLRVLTQDGDAYLGKLIPNNEIDAVLRKFGATSTKATYKADDLYDKVYNKGQSVSFDNDTKLIRRKVSGENRLELTGKNLFRFNYDLKDVGLFTEFIQGERRYFIPADKEKGIKAIEKLLTLADVNEVIQKNNNELEFINEDQNSEYKVDKTEKDAKEYSIPVDKSGHKEVVYGESKESSVEMDLDETEVEDNDESMAMNVDNDHQAVTYFKQLDAEREDALNESVKEKTHKRDLDQKIYWNGEKVSKFYTNSITNTELLPEDMKALLDECEFTYNTQTNPDQLQRAQARIDTDILGVMDEIIKKDAINSGDDAAAALLITKRLKDIAQETNNYADVIDWLHTIQPKITATAQALQAIGMWKRMSPEGVLKTAVKAMDESRTEDDDSKLEDETNDILDQLDDVEKETAEEFEEDVPEEVQKEIGKIESNKDDNAEDDEPLGPEALLAKKIKSRLELKVPHSDPVKRMVDELFKVAKESPIESNVITTDPLTFVTEAIINRQEYVETWKKAKEIVREEFKDDPTALSTLDEYFDKGIKPPFSSQSFMKVIKNSMKELDINLTDMVKEYYAKGHSQRGSLVKLIMDKSGLSGESAKVLENFIQNKMKELTKAKKEAILKSKFKIKELTTVKADPLKSVEELYNLGAFDNENYKNRIFEKLAPKVKALLKQDDINIGEMVRKSLTEQTYSRGKFLQEISEKLKVNYADSFKILQAIDARFTEIANEKKSMILKNMFTKRAQVTRKSMVDKLIEMTNLGAFNEAAIRQLVAEYFEIPTVTDSMAKELIARAEAIQAMKDGREKDIQKALMMGLISSKIPISKLRKIATFQTMNMLSSVKTFLKNLGGNVGFAALKNSSDVLAAVIDKATYEIMKVMGSKNAKRTQYMPSLVTQGKAFVKYFSEGYQDAKLGIDTMDLPSQYDIPITKTFRKGALGAIETIVNISLRSTDKAFFGAAFEDSLRIQLKASKLEVPTEEMLDKAMFDGLYATFQDKNIISDAFVGIKKNLNLGKEFGLGDVLLKFPKTPANILARGIDYSPVSITKSIFELCRPLCGKKFRQEEFVRSLSQGAVGSGLLFAGMILWVLGIISSGRDKDKEVDNLQSEMGLGGYTINLSALKRFVMSGFNSNEAKLQKGDTIMNYDWLQPASMPIAAGANVMEAKKQAELKKKVTALDILGAVGVALRSGVNSLAEQPVLQGLAKATRGYDVAASLGEALKSVPATFVPLTTLVNQARQYVDNTSRKTKDKDGNKVTEAVNLIKNKIPGLSKELPANVTTTGNVKEMYQDGSNSILNTFLNPANVRKYKETPASDFLLELYDKTGNKDIFPREVQKNLTINKITIPLTDEEISKMQEYQGKKTMDMIDTYFVKSKKQYTEEEQIIIMKKILNIASEFSKNKVKSEIGKQQLLKRMIEQRGK